MSASTCHECGRLARENKFLRAQADAFVLDEIGQMAMAAFGLRGFTIRLMTAPDVTALARIVSVNYCVDYARQFRLEAAEALRGSIFAPTFWVATDAGIPIGCAAWACSTIDWNVVCLTWVNVASDRQRRGVGQAVVTQTLRDAASSYSTALLTTRSPRWYERWGFKSVSLLSGEKGEPYHLMTCDLMKTFTKERGTCSAPHSP
jgi:predicted N-acetyltransferase YhbS